MSQSLEIETPAAAPATAPRPSLRPPSDDADLHERYPPARRPARRDDPPPGGRRLVSPGATRSAPRPRSCGSSPRSTRPARLRDRLASLELAAAAHAVAGLQPLFRPGQPHRAAGPAAGLAARARSKPRSRCPRRPRKACGSFASAAIRPRPWPRCSLGRWYCRFSRPTPAKPVAARSWKKSTPSPRQLDTPGIASACCPPSRPKLIDAIASRDRDLLADRHRPRRAAARCRRDSPRPRAGEQHAVRGGAARLSRAGSRAGRSLSATSLDSSAAAALRLLDRRRPRRQSASSRPRPRPKPFACTRKRS